MLSPIESVLHKLTSNYVNGVKESIHSTTKEFNHLQMVFDNFVIKGESNSLIVLGPSGCGKTTFIESALWSLGSDKNFKVIQLSGVHCNDLKSSMLAISYSLELDDELASLIGDGNNFEDRLADILKFLRASLTSSSIPLIIILDRIDLFCEHRGQALLYNLFDIVQTEESPLCVIGVTTRVDILELLEKRVKSRFSHRILQLGSVRFEHYCHFAKNIIIMKNESKNCRKWNVKVETLLSSKALKQVLQSLYDFDNTVAALVNFLYTLLMECDDEKLTIDHVSSTYANMCMSSTVKQAMDLSVAEMFMMLAIYRSAKNGNHMFKFLNLYEIVGKAAESSSLRKEDLLIALTSLAEHELIIPVDKKSEEIEKYYKSEVTAREFSDIFKFYPKLPSVFQKFL